jgi:hypothetical protein
MMPSLTDIFAAIGASIVAAGGVGAFLFGLFKLLGEKWLNAKFEERLATFKHAQQQEIEHLRFRINALMDRTTKLHQRQFDALPEAWGRLVDAFEKTNSLWFRFDPNLDEMKDSQLDAFLSKTPLQDWER